MTQTGKAWLVGGGIASLAAAAFLIRDGGMSGPDIHVFEASDRFGGSLDGSGNERDGFVIRGGRMFEPHFACTLDLFDTIPAGDGSGRSVTRQVLDFTADVVPSSRCRIVRRGRRIEAPALGLSRRHRRELAALFARPESTLDGRTIEDAFDASFFATDFWRMWATMFAFQPWHSLAEMRRYMRRFVHLMSGFNRLQGIVRTPLNQYDSLVAPLLRWLGMRGVQLHTDAIVTDVVVRSVDGVRRVAALTLRETGGRTRTGAVRTIEVAPQDHVFVTLGSMTDASTLGDHDRPAPVPRPDAAPSWALWRRIAAQGDDFGHPEGFCGAVERSEWLSFTVTLRGSAFFERMESFTGNRAGTGGLVTLADSPWWMSIVLPHQPHFADQPEHTTVFWGYGLFPARTGTRVARAMYDCNGAELLHELVHHLGMAADAERMFAGARCIPCRMPFITSQFLPRFAGDRPHVVPEGAANFAFLGQFCEQPLDTVFTVEYSVRSAWTAVQRLLSLDREPPGVYRGDLDPRVLWRAARAMTD